MGFDPVSMMVISAALQVGSGVMGYMEQKKADRAAKAQADSEANLMMQDAERQATEERKAGKEAAARQRMLYLTSGVDLTGSPLLEVQRTVRQGQQNAETVLGNASTRADMIRKQGGMSRASLVGSALQTGSNVMGTYMNYQGLKKQLVPAPQADRMYASGTTQNFSNGTSVKWN